LGESDFLTTQFGYINQHYKRCDAWLRLLFNFLSFVNKKYERIPGTTVKEENYITSIDVIDKATDICRYYDNEEMPRIIFLHIVYST